MYMYVIKIAVLEIFRNVLITNHLTVAWVNKYEFIENMYLPIILCA